MNEKVDILFTLLSLRAPIINIEIATVFFFSGRRSSLWEIRGIGSITKVLFQYVPNQSTFRSYRAEHSGMERFQLVGQIGRVPFKLFICVKICTLVTNNSIER